MRKFETDYEQWKVKFEILKNLNSKGGYGEEI